MEFTALFHVAMWWRIVYGFLRIFLSITLLKLIGTSFADITYGLMAHEFTGKTGDFFLERLYAFFEIHELTVTYFVAFYFFFWGIIEIVLALCLLRKVMWAFPTTMGIIGLFIIYSIFRYTHTESSILLIVIFIDLAILFLVNHEYQKLRKYQNSLSKI